jgi:glycerophosphoryl diester phosphodiesterase
MTLQLDRVIGHRGACGHAPENTIASMSKAHALGTKWVEFDVMLAGCGEPIIIHDGTLDRTTNGAGEVAKLNYQTISQLDCGSWFSEQYSGEQIPTLNQLLQHVANLNLAINVEIKPTLGFEHQTTEKTLQSLKSHWPITKNPLLLSSFSIEVLATLHRLYTNYPLGYVINTWDSHWEEMLDRYDCVSLHVDHAIITPGHVQKVKESGRFLLAYTVNDLARAKELFAWGVDSVFTDFPDRIMAID